MWKIFLAILKLAPRIFFTFLFKIWPYNRHPEKYPIEVRYKTVRKLIIKVINTLRVDQKVEGIENLRALEKNKEKFLVIGNHLSVIDPLLLIYHSEEPLTFVGKKEILKMPLVRTIIKVLDGMFLDRNDLRSGLQVIRNVERLIKNNIASVAIYPEGTRNKNPEGELPEFHGGTFKPAFRIGCPVLPVASFGSQKILSKKTTKRVPYELTYFPATFAGENSEENTVRFAKEMHDLIAKEMYRQREEDRLFFEEHKEKIPMRKGSVR